MANCWGWCSAHYFWAIRYLVFVTGTECTEETYIVYEEAVAAAKACQKQHGLSMSIWDYRAGRIIYTTPDEIIKVDWQKEGF